MLYGQLETGHWTKDNLDLIEDALQAARASGMQWSTKVPKVPGWYWSRTTKGGIRSDITIWFYFDVASFRRHQRMNEELCQGFTEWAGPLAPPEETGG